MLPPDGSRMEGIQYPMWEVQDITLIFFEIQNSMFSGINSIHLPKQRGKFSTDILFNIVNCLEMSPTECEYRGLTWQTQGVTTVDIQHQTVLFQIYIHETL